MMRLRLPAFPLSLAWSAVLAGAVAASAWAPWVHAAEPGFRVACINARTGELLWKGARGDLPRPHVALHGDTVVVTDGTPGSPPLETLRYVDGAPVPVETLAAGAEGGPVFQQVTDLPAPRTVGAEFTLQPPAGRTITATVKGQALPLVTLDVPVQALVAVEGTAVALTDGRAGLGLELVAVDVKTRAHLWTVPLARRMADLDEAAPGLLAVDGSDVVVAVDGWLARVGAQSGVVAWSSHLPKGHAPWRRTGPPRVGRDGDRYVAAFGDVLMVVAVQDGKVRAAYSGGLGSAPWPVVVEDRMLLPWTDARVAPDLPARMTPEARPKVVVITRDPQWLGGYRADFVGRKDVPAREAALHPLQSPVPPQTDRAGERMVLHLVEPAGDDGGTMRLDVTEALQRRGRVFVRLSPRVNRVLLMKGTRQVFSSERPG